MRRTFLAATLVVGVLFALPAHAQVATPSSSEPAKLTIGAIGGVASVQHVGGMAGGELAIRVNRRISVVAEGIWMQDVVTRRRVELADSVATFLTNTQGKTASSEIKVPAVYGGAGLRVMLRTEGRLRPYLTLTGGVARLAIQPAFILGGSDITNVLPQYGVTLGSDLTGETTKPAFSGGLGVRMDRGRWYTDFALRVTSIRTSGQPTNAIGASLGLGRRF